MATNVKHLWSTEYTFTTLVCSAVSPHPAAHVVFVTLHHYLGLVLIRHLVSVHRSGSRIDAPNGARSTPPKWPRPSASRRSWATAMRATAARQWTRTRRASIWGTVTSASGAAWTTRCANSTWPDAARRDHGGRHTRCRFRCDSVPSPRPDWKNEREREKENVVHVTMFWAHNYIYIV